MRISDPTYLSLLAAIRAAPDDDGARLMAADRLDELGHDARAELIRVQIQLVQLPAARPVLRLDNVTTSLPYREDPYSNPDPLPTVMSIAGTAIGQYEVIAMLREGQAVDAEFGSEQTGRYSAPNCTLLYVERPWHGHGLWHVRLRCPLSYQRLEGGDLRQSLQQRERELLPLMTWPSTGRISSSIGSAYRRGFIEKVHCSCQTWLDHAGMIYEQAPALRQVVLIDKQPMAPIWSWWDVRYYEEGQDHPESDLPSPLYSLLQDKTDIAIDGCEYPNRDAALAALSGACLRYAHEQYQHLNEEAQP